MKGAPPPDPNRFKAAKSTLFIDAFMTRFIKVGGAMVVSAVFGIFIFIGSQILPLFRGAEVREAGSMPVPADDYLFMGADEWGEKPFFVTKTGAFVFCDPKSGTTETIRPAELGDHQVSSAFYRPETGTVALGTATGGYLLGKLGFSSAPGGSGRIVTPKLEWMPFVENPGNTSPVTKIASGEIETVKLVATYQQAAEGRPHNLKVTKLERKRSLIGAGKWVSGGEFDLTHHLSAPPRSILVTSTADAVLVLMENGEVEYFFLTPGGFELRQKFHPFEDRPGEKVLSIDFLLGDVSIVAVGNSGANRIFSLYVRPGEVARTFGQTKVFPDLPADSGDVRFFGNSQRNKAFLVAGGNSLSLRYGTTETVRWEKELATKPLLGMLGAKYDRIMFLGADNRLHLMDLHDPHPEASFQGLFGKVWYEGASEPAYVWQSSSGTDDFEPKFSLVPLVFGTLKGTLYAMLFAVPIALLAAIYTSQFLRPEIRAIVKPTMEIMASLPSVVLGFLAALWLAPILETRVPSLLLALIFISTGAYLFGLFWSSLPYALRRRVPPGAEFAVVLPLILLFGYLGWEFGPVLERAVFVTTDPTSGMPIADFRRWWPAVTGTVYEQRNSLIVGFMMGFAVIPIIFTITEDALSNVPGALRSGSLALGASRWQTAMRIVLPTASAGIFSAIMIGLGRAVGETMIVVMATGNTPIMEWNIFSGMRTLSANIAVELPEAPQVGTLYRTLFLGAMVLFLMTFFVNTIAEILRQWLREKYKTV